MNRMVICLALVVISCSKPPKLSTEIYDYHRVPIAVVIDREILGNILNRDINEPFGLAVRSDGSVFVADGGNSRLLQFDSTLKPIHEVGGFGSSAGLFNKPTYIMVDNELNLLISDEGNRRLTRFDSRLQFVDEIILEDEQDILRYGYPSGIAVNEFGELWVAEYDRDRISVFDNVGKFDRYIGDFGYSGGQLSSPEEIVVDYEGNFIVCDADNSRIVVYDRFGNYSRQFTNDSFVYPMAIAIDRQLLWILDGNTQGIMCLTRQGELLFTTGPSIVGSSVPLKQPSDIVLMKDGRLLVSDTGNNRLLVCRIIYDGP